jgi:hypothetical protein
LVNDKDDPDVLAAQEVVLQGCADRALLRLADAPPRDPSLPLMRVILEVDGVPLEPLLPRIEDCALHGPAYLNSNVLSYSANASGYSLYSPGCNGCFRGQEDNSNGLWMSGFPQPAPLALAPAPSGLAPAPSGLGPAPSGLAPAPSALGPAPSALGPAPSGLAPAPSGLAPAPSGLGPLPLVAVSSDNEVYMPLYRT